MHDDTKAWLRVKKDIEHYAANPIEAPRVSAMRRANPKSEVNNVAAFKIGKYSKAKAAGASKANADKYARGEISLAKATGKPARKKSTKKTKAKTKAKAKTKRKGTRKGQVRKTARRAFLPSSTASAAAPKKRRRTSAKKGARRTKAVQTKVERSVKVPRAKTQVVRIELTGGSARRGGGKKKGGTRKRKKNPSESMISPADTMLSMHPNPVDSDSGLLGGLLSNPAGPFSGESLRGFAVAAGGVGAGLVIADFVDRYVATRTPADSAGEGGTAKAEGQHPWYGRDAAAAQRRRPDAMRLGAQAAGAIAAMALTYWTRRGNVLPWLFGGTAVGFGANLLKQLTDWYLMPMVFSVDEDKPNEATFANRMFPLEQPWVQDKVDELFANWQGVPALRDGQQKEPLVQSPLAAAGQGVYVLGKAGSGNGMPQPGSLGSPASPQFIHTGRLGKCHSCGGYNGCWYGCKESGCADCGTGINPGPRGGNGNGRAAKKQRCMYVVEPGDDFASLVASANANVTQINAMNGGCGPDTYWKVGNRVMLPYEMCKYIEDTQGPPVQPCPPPNGGLPVTTTSVIEEVVNGGGGMTTQTALPRQPNGGGMTTQTSPNYTEQMYSNVAKWDAPNGMMRLGNEPKTAEERVHALFSDDD
jgi:hypothetical protein